MARETWHIDGWELTQGIVRDLEYRAGLYRTPAVDGTDSNVSNRTGRLWRPKTHGPGQFTLAVWLGGASRAEAERLYDELLRAVVHPHRLATYRRGLADGTARECSGDVTAALEPTAIGQQGMRLGIEVTVPRAYWRGTVLRTAQRTVPLGATVVTLPLPEFARSTAPMEGLTYRITGPVTSPTVADITDDGVADSFTYSGVIGSGQTLVVNSDTWQVTGEGFTPNQAAMNYTGRVFLPVVAARPGRTPTLRLTGTSMNTATTLRVSGYEAFLL